jgi:hydroxymethylglutaryl-CoA lyase
MDVRIVEVGPRDGLQNEKKLIPTEQKIEWINRLSATGLRYIEASSFVNPKWIPQLADAVEVFAGIDRAEGVTYSALVPNLRGLDRAKEAGVSEIAVFMSASETHNRKNINKSIEETFPVLEETVSAALSLGMKVRGYISTVFGCPYEGEVPVSQTVRVGHALLKMGVYELSIGDTIGVATPKQIREKFRVLVQEFGAERLAGHFHDTRGTGLANVAAALEEGIRTFDSSLGGLGGCPYAPGASGNISTEDLVYLLEGMGLSTGVRLDRLLEAGMFIQQALGRNLPSKLLQVHLSSCATGEANA